MTRILGAGLALLAAALAARPAGAADWPLFRGNEARTGYAAEQAAPPLTAAWNFQAGGSILSSPAVYDGVVYFGARDGYVYALDARTGAERWRFRTANWVDSSPAVSSSAVYAASLDGHLYAIARLTGAPLWRVDLGGPSASSPLVSGGKVYAGSGLPDNKLRVYDTDSGALLGAFQAPQPVDSAPAAYAGRVYFGANDGWIYSLDASSLLPAAGWNAPQSGGLFRMNAVAVSSGLVYALPGHDDKKLYALDALTGNESARSLPLEDRDSWMTFASPAVAGGRAYFSGALGEYYQNEILYPAGDVYLSAVDSGTLVSVWGSSPTLGAIADMGVLSSPAAADDLLYSGTVDGRLVAITLAGVQAASVDLSSSAYSSPAVSNGMIYIGTMAGRLLAYRAGRTAALSAPVSGEIVAGTVAVRGYFDNPALTGYELAYSTGGLPQVWHGIVSSDTVHAAGEAPLAEWDTSLLDNGNYSLRLTVLESGVPAYDNSSVAEVRINAAPNPPSGLSASDVPADAGNNIMLSWTASSTPGVTGYRVYRDAGEGPVLLGVPVAGLNAYNDAAAVTGSTYTYTVKAFDGWVESEASLPASAFSVNNTGDSAAPSAVTDLAAGPGPAPGMVLLRWTATGNDGGLGTAASYVIKYTTVAGYNWAGFDTGAGLAVSTRGVEGPAGVGEAEEISWLLGGVTYYFALKAADFVPNVSGLSNIATAYASLDTVPPAPPSGLAVADTPGDDGGSLGLSWTLSSDDGAGAGDVYGYRIYRRTQASSYVSSAPYASVGRGVRSYTDTAATANVRYYYSVAAFDSTLGSALTAEAYGVSADNWRFFDAGLGCSVRLSDGARVDIPGGAASQNSSIMFLRLDPGTYQPLFRLKSEGRVNPTGLVYEVRFQNPVTSLVRPAVISLPYTPVETAGMTEENLRVYTLSGGTWKMLNTSAVDAQAKRVSAEVNSFSVFSIMEYIPAGALLSSDEVYTYPNPAKGDTVTFKFKPAYKSYVKIEVFNVAGEKVAKLEKADCPAGQASEIVWNVRNIASGVYIFRLEASSSAGSRTMTKKLAIAH